MNNPSTHRGSLLYPPETLRQYFDKDGDRQIAHFSGVAGPGQSIPGEYPPDTLTPRIGKKTGLRGALRYFADECPSLSTPLSRSTWLAKPEYQAERNRLWALVLGRAQLGTNLVTDPNSSWSGQFRLPRYTWMIGADSRPF